MVLGSLTCNWAQSSERCTKCALTVRKTDSLELVVIGEVAVLVRAELESDAAGEVDGGAHGHRGRVVESRVGLQTLWDAFRDRGEWVAC